MVGEHEDRALPRSAVGSEVTDDAVEAVAPREDGAGGVDVLLVQPLANGCPVHEVHRVPRSGDEAVQRHQEVEEHLPCCGLWLGVSHDRFLPIWP
jgi:hypothetical protein